MRARGPVIASADAEGDLPQLEVGQELLPLGGIELAVFFAGSFGSAAGDERPMVSDHVLGVDRGVPHRGVQHRMAADLRGDVRPERPVQRPPHRFEAEREGWPGEIEGLKVSLAGADDKLAQIDAALRRQATTVQLGMPAFPDTVPHPVPADR
jgi:hypothetical protein